jgi:hypothetical protein
MQTGKESERAMLAMMMMGNAVLMTVLRRCCGSFGRTLRVFGSAFGGHALGMSEDSISRQCCAVLRY